ncbi:T9SS type A sorting domain-containing protein [Algibacter sp. 2305UL17-15]|uniref:T9SS type A sorting domain-containing protein n=1 Tax=Algibacter sp. 2305UL17-15 TaxID=3231268 RepID=UPI003457EC3B
MKSKLLLSLFLFLTLHTFSQQYTSPVPKTWYIDTPDGAGWKNFSHIEYEFNNDCLPTTVTAQALNFVTDNLENSTLLLITYENGNQKATGINHTWNGTDWDETQKFVHTYTNDIILETINYDWDNGDWEKTKKISYSYDGSNRTTEIITYLWNDSIDDWVNSEKQNYIYYNNTMYYETELGYEHDGTDWVNSYKSTYTFSASTLIEDQEHQDWVNGDWEEDFFIEYNYDVNGFLTEELWHDWNESSNQYVEKTKEIITNNAQGHRTTVISQSYILGSWTNTSRQRFTYPTCSALSTQEFNDQALTLYPNPTKDQIHINSPNQLKEYSIINVNGQVLKKGRFENNSNSLDISNFPKGIYFLNFKTETGVISKKIIKN